jgi:hypothetical protein
LVGGAFEYASEGLKSNEDFVLRAVQLSGLACQVSCGGPMGLEAPLKGSSGNVCEFYKMFLYVMGILLPHYAGSVQNSSTVFRDKFHPRQITEISIIVQYIV